MKTVTQSSYDTLEIMANRQRLEELAAKSLASTRARLILGRDSKSAFFATLALRLKPEVDWSLDTMATDGSRLLYSPKFVMDLSTDELLGVLVHEVMHNALGHHCRQGDRETSQWNIACDLAINPLLVQSGYVLPRGRLMPGEGSYAQFAPGKSAEEYYSLLAELGSSKSESSDPGGCGQVMEPELLSPEEIRQEESNWQVALAQAEQTARTKGELPAGLGRAVEEVLQPSLDWREVLRELVSQTAKNNYSWSRPNRRYISQGLYLPGLCSEELGLVMIAIDTSGSVNEQQLDHFAAEVTEILSAYSCTARILFHDTEVRHVQHWDSSEADLKLEPVGGGGTSHECVFQWLEHEQVEPACLICLTDLDTEFPTQVPSVPVLWGVIGDNTSQPPFGRRVSVSFS